MRLKIFMSGTLATFMLNKRNKGFTLIELMVAVSLFTTVSVIATGAVLSANQISKKAQAIKLAMDNLNFALDSMTLKMKKGGGYYCIGDGDSLGPTGSTPTYPLSPESQACSSPGGTAIAFYLDNNATKYIYRFSGDRLEFSQNNGASSMTPFARITASEITIDTTKSRFYVYDVDAPAKQPRIVIRFYGQAKVGKETSDFAVETTVSDRR